MRVVVALVGGGGGLGVVGEPEGGKAALEAGQVGQVRVGGGQLLLPLVLAIGVAVVGTIVHSLSQKETRPLV